MKRWAVGLAAVAVFVAAGSTDAAVIFQHVGSTDPTSEGWTTAGSGATVGPVTDDLGMGVDAWYVDDSSTGVPSILTYLQITTDDQLAQASGLGWKLSARLRVVDVDDAVDQSVRFTYTNETRRYGVAFGSDADGDPIVVLGEGADDFSVWGPSYTLEGEGSTYHLYELIFDPVVNSAALFVDGIQRLSGFTGITAPDPNIKRVLWGSGNSYTTGQGNYNLVQWEIDPETPTFIPEPSTFIIWSLLGALTLTIAFLVKVSGRSRVWVAWSAQGEQAMKRWLLVLAVVGMLVGVGQAKGATYSLIDLGDLPGGDNTSYAFALNNAGQVVGQGNGPTGGIGGGITHAFLWDPVNGMQNLGGKVAYDINDSSQVVGYAEMTVGQQTSAHAFLWDPVTGMQDLGEGIAYGINNSGQVVGDAFLWDPVTGVRDLGVLPGDVRSSARDINDSSQIVGFGDSSDRAILWDPVDAIQNLGSLWAPVYGEGKSFAYGINNNGQVVGQVQWGSSPSNSTAFLWDKMEGMRPIDGSLAYDINESGQVVGVYITGQGTHRAMGPYGPLNDQLDASGAGWVLEYAYDINDAGQIVGSGWGPNGYHGYLLTLIPEPSTLILLSIGTLTLTIGWWRRRR